VVTTHIFWLPNGKIVHARNNTLSLFVTQSKTTVNLPIAGPLAQLLAVLP
jgi:hypothetical protein